MGIKKEINKGDIYNNWTIIKEVEMKVEPSGSWVRVVLCKCKCGTLKKVKFANLCNNRSKCCGCIGVKKRRILTTKHGEHSRKRTTPEYTSWLLSRDRCNNKNNKNYKYYGGRGIKHRISSVIDLLNEIGRRPTPQHSLDRIDNDGDYEIGNIRWATRSEQMNNTRRSKKRE